jgi:hypothetical protein
MKMFLGVAALVAVVIPESGCLQKDVTEAWYLEPNGAVTWQVAEQYVRSDGDSLEARHAEEQAYIDAVRVGRQPVARGLMRLGVTMPETRIVRGTAPFAVVTDGHFSDIGMLGRQLLAATGNGGSSILQQSAGTFTWTLTVIDNGQGDSSVGDHDDALPALLADFEHLRIVLIDGHFTSAQGFELSSDRRVATLTAFSDEARLSNDPTLVIGVSWTSK